MSLDFFRPFVLADAPSLAEAVRETSPKSGRCLVWMSDEYSVQDAEAFIRNAGQNAYNDRAYEFGLFDAAGRVLGGVAIHSIRRNLNSGDIGYWVRESEQGKGYAKRAARYVRDFAFTSLALTRLNICTAVDNIASRHVAENCGFEFMGIKPHIFPPSDGMLFTVFKKGRT